MGERGKKRGRMRERGRRRGGGEIRKLINPTSLFLFFCPLSYSLLSLSLSLPSFPP